MDGPRHVPHYGLLLAGVAGLPSSVVETARSITARITEKVIVQMTNQPSENSPWCASSQVKVQYG